jgi:hypothetical protein
VEKDGRERMKANKEKVGPLQNRECEERKKRDNG